MCVLLLYPACLPSLQIVTDATGQDVVQNLFQEFKPTEMLPDVVNEPTLERLTRFIHDDLGQPQLQPTRYTVRALVSELFKFNASGTLCWNLAGTAPSAPHGGVSRTSSATTSATTRDASTEVAMVEMAATQRVFAHCAQPVVVQVESVLAEEKALLAATVDLRRPLATQAGAAHKKETLYEWAERLEFGDILPALKGVSTLRDVHFMVKHGKVTAASLKARGLPEITVLRFITAVDEVCCGMN